MTAILLPKVPAELLQALRSQTTVIAAVWHRAVERLLRLGSNCIAPCLSSRGMVTPLRDVLHRGDLGGAWALASTVADSASQGSKRL